MARLAPLASGADTILAARLRLVITRLGRRLRRHGGGELTPSQLSALVSIERGGPLTLGELSAVEGVRPPTMTKVVCALEEQGLVQRSDDPTDRRLVRLAITDAGDELLTRARSRSDAYLAARLRGLSPDDRVALERAAGVLERMLQTDE